MTRGGTIPGGVYPQTTGIVPDSMMRCNEETMDQGMGATALLTIDVQRDFFMPGAPAEIPGTLALVPVMARLVSAFRQAGLPVIHMVRLYLADGSNADLCRREMIAGGLQLVRPGTPGSQLAPELLPRDGLELNAPLLLAGGIQKLARGEAVIYKPRWGAFFETPLENHLAILQTETLVICGCNFPNCPRATIYEASERDYRVIAVQDALSGLYERALQELRDIGVACVHADDVIGRLKAWRQPV